MRHIKVAPYEALAEIYDLVMSHVDYRKWVEFSLALLSENGLPHPREDLAPRILECACGTGTMAVFFALNGYRVDAFDSSASMIEIARAKTSDIEPSPNIFIADFLTFEAQGLFDAVLCLYDSVNYLASPDQVHTFFERVLRVLRPGGLFLFDICTEKNSMLFFADRKQEEQGDGYSMRRKVNYYPDTRIQENRFWICLDERPDVVMFECHQQQIYPVEQIRQILIDTGFEIVNEFDGFHRHPPTPNSLRVHFLCRRGENLPPAK